MFGDKSLVRKTFQSCNMMLTSHLPVLSFLSQLPIAFVQKYTVLSVELL
jgi:hypothetical protein